jgi:molybdopterin/thiamine biosynthesis adenylyltransferase
VNNKVLDMSRTNVIRHEGVLDKSIYDERVSRAEVFLGRTPEEQKRSQELLANSTVGIAGTGGIGGAMAMRLARLGVRHLKLADPQPFDWTNVNRQLGAEKKNIGRNKAVVVGEMVNDLAGDVTIDVYPDGITTDNAEDFVDGCDVVLDQLDFSVLAEKYALHRAFRKNRKIKNILACSVVGWAAHLYKFEHDSMKIEDWYGVPDASSLTPENVDRLIKLWAPKVVRFPTYEVVQAWMHKTKGVPIFTGTPPLAEGILIQRVALVLMGLEKPPYATYLPPIPAMYCYDALTFEGEFVTSDGTQPNVESVASMWRDFDRGEPVAAAQ